MKGLKRLLPFIIGLTILMMGYYGGWWDYFLKRSSTPATTLKPAVPSIDIIKSKLAGWDKEKKSWEIEADRIWQTEDGSYVYFHKITHGVAYSVKDKRIDFTAGWARWERMKEMLYLGGNLEAKVDDITMKTVAAVLNYRTEKLTSDTGVQYNRKEAWATAQSIRVNFSEEEVTLEGDLVLVQNNDHITADGLIYNQKTETYHLIGPKGVMINP
ncbi:MAG TPA: hypothetical protein DDW65_03005 [Firmicutes bacterium]|jgi:hypothetical protein|nr:hypothetical protein [Bacillota bacterium]